MEDVDEMRETCEQQELTSLNGVASVDVYKQLLIVYLIDSDVINAKFLWKRIPEQLKSDDLELQHIWKIGQFLWRRDFGNVFTTVSTLQWSSVTQSLLKKLLENLRTRLTHLIAQAYSIIKIENMCLMLGLEEAEVLELAVKNSWEVDMTHKLIKPKVNKERVAENAAMSESLLNSLTDYISFLEN